MGERGREWEGKSGGSGIGSIGSRRESEWERWGEGEGEVGRGREGVINPLFLPGGEEF